MRKLFVLLFLITSFSCLSQEKVVITQNSKNIPCKVSKVVDGDTFYCIANGEEIKVRLIGVDTPESHKNPKALRDAEKTGMRVEDIIKMGKTAYEFTKRLIPEGTTVYLETDVQLTDRYGRILAYVWLPDGRMLNEVLVREGYAQVYTIPPNVKYQEILLSAQRKAREEGKGFWNSNF
ncbi:thermonuclease family protein [Hydrogenobacter hydrogenophilus]|uniref:Micrococcal nuclease n=1 Tax=Hydrogenobacter hydrogenophilus TaxID=35835 RepID=A0A285NWH9_9AQUI|nr:thermonuclease family protein [Hydrogenobacter hydrogenophilus]SNZ12246.1 micrococcal nuclease [Hydrogenobacter hydrogenophilus]